MMVLSSSDTARIRAAAHQFPEFVGWLITPRVFYKRRSMREIDALWAADNDCYKPENFSPDGFKDMLLANLDVRERCLFVSAPDVVGDAGATLERFFVWERVIRVLGFPVALVAQDGLEDEWIPWDRLDALFIGGSTKWKLSQAAVGLMREARSRGKWVHVGRVNSQKRFRHCWWAGADSVDGTTFGICPDDSLAWALPLLRSLDVQARLGLV